MLSDQYCQVAYPSANSWLGYPEEGSSFQRPLLCFTTGTTSSSPTSKDAKTAAIAHCPKTCGLCCQTSTYSCQNAPCRLYFFENNIITFQNTVPRLNCASVTKAMCLSITWRQILAEDCPNFCGFCDLNGCIDLVTGCDSDVSICNAIGMQEFVNLNCRRTCGRCSVATPKPCSGR